jgi:hypothetical protein
VVVFVVAVVVVVVAFSLQRSQRLLMLCDARAGSLTSAATSWMAPSLIPSDG